MSRIQLLSVLLTLVCVVGCKVRIQVPEGGSVMSQSGAYTCSSGETCDIDVVDVHFNEVFTATAAPGFKFDGWKRRDRGLCGGSDDVCALSTEGFVGNEALLNFLESPDEIFFLEPVFSALVTDAFDPAVFEDARFRAVQEGIQVNYRFRGDGTYSLSSPPLFASGEWEFRAGNRVIFFSRLADTNSDDLTGYAVFKEFSEVDKAYKVCFIEDQSVRSVPAAIDICENGSGSVAVQHLTYQLQ